MKIAAAGENHIINLEDVRHIERYEKSVPLDSKEYARYVEHGGEEPKTEQVFHFLIYYKNIRDPITVHFGTGRQQWDEVFIDIKAAMLRASSSS